MRKEKANQKSTNETRMQPVEPPRKKNNRQKKNFIGPQRDNLGNTQPRQLALFVNQSKARKRAHLRDHAAISGNVAIPFAVPRSLLPLSYFLMSVQTNWQTDIQRVRSLSSTAPQPYNYKSI